MSGPAVTPALIGVDWGTSSLRAYLLAADGAILARHASARGILSVDGGGFEGVLAAAVAPWLAGSPPPPILMSGMIGSRQGWHEAPYAAAPVAAAALAGLVVPVPAAHLARVHLVPGIMQDDGVGPPDVMRGEETQIIGALAALGDRDGALVLPGSHAKWVEIADGAIAAFRTYMTGEVFAALAGHTILGRLMSDAPGSGQGFAEGVRRARVEAATPGRLLNLVFSARTLGLFSRLPASELSDYLSGLLIGAEMIDALPRPRPFTIIATAALSRRYETAAALLGLSCRRAPDDCVVQGHVALARAAGLIGRAP